MSKKESMQSNQKLSPPWINYVREISVLFGNDPDIDVSYDNDTYTVKLLVANPVKADAISKLLPTEKEFGNVILKIEVVPGNEEMTEAQLYSIAFSNNPVFSFSQEVRPQGIETPITYIVFKKEVVQYFNDDLTDLYGNRTTLLHEIAKDVLPEKFSVNYCVDKDE